MSKIISEYIKEARKAQRMTLRTLSDKSGVSVGHLSEFENGKTELGGDKLVKVCKALGISPDVERGMVLEPLTGYEVTSVQQSLPLDERIKRLGLNAKDTRGLLELLKLDEDQKDEYIKQMMIHNLEKGRY